ncbi:hypothetical protein GCM10010885_07410 [Alicyclobacillus cellulosilyticus]|uniref:Uncharacterized protein n=1 Tax=Alicyclobacillus cellulosilyticus TaxID=1003997 RepID=A0A917K5G0_9BACL|nr:hypothetical protein GCM10010885_07410 [Alicyclobacillus cellulosilyticus]
MHALSGAVFKTHAINEGHGKEGKGCGIKRRTQTGWNRSLWEDAPIFDTQSFDTLEFTHIVCDNGNI